MNTKIYKFLSEDAKAVREAVFIKEQGFKNEFDNIDNIAWHIVMYNENEEPIAVCRVFESEDKTNYILGRLAVLHCYRGNNIGRDMLKRAENLVLNCGGKALSLHAQCRVKSFYEKSGYISYGEIEDDEGCPHIWMKKQL